MNELFRDARLACQMSQEELARRLSISSAYLSLVERALRIPSPPTVLAITQELKIPAYLWLPAYLNRETRVATLVRMADHLISSGQFAEARQIIQVVFFRNRKQYGGRYNREICHIAGKLNYQIGRPKVSLLWFNQMNRHLPHSNILTRGVALYDHGLALYQSQHISEAFSQLDNARAMFGVHHRQYRGLATWGMATCLFDQFFYHEARRYFRESLKDIRKTPHVLEVTFGLALTTWITNPSSQTLQSLVDFNGTEPLTDHLKNRWLLAMTIVHRRLGLYDKAISFASQIEATASPATVYTEGLAEQALCALEMGNVIEMWKHVRKFQDTSFDSTDVARTFISLLTHVATHNCNLIEIQWGFVEGYDQRIKRLVKIWGDKEGQSIHKFIDYDFE